MFRLVIRRLALGLLTLVLVSGIVFVAVEALPGDACTAYLGRMAQGTRLENCRRDFGLEPDRHGLRLDYCFLDPHLGRRVKHAHVDSSAQGSDHRPYWVELDL